MITKKMALKVLLLGISFEVYVTNTNSEHIKLYEITNFRSLESCKYANTAIKRALQSGRRSNLLL